MFMPRCFYCMIYTCNEGVFMGNRYWSAKSDAIKRRFSPGSRRPRWQNVRSSNLKRVRYSEHGELLDIEFMSGHIYRYYDVPLREYVRLMSATSHGRYHYYNIRMDYEYEKIKAVLDLPETALILYRNQIRHAAPHDFLQYLNASGLELLKFSD